MYFSGGFALGALKAMILFLFTVRTTFRQIATSATDTDNDQTGLTIGRGAPTESILNTS